MNDKTQEKIGKMQLLEQNIQNFMMQKQQFQMQLVEIESALEELDKSDTSYKIIGNIMVLSNKDELKKDLDSKKEMVELRIKTIEKQEKGIKEKAQELQKEVLNDMKE